MDLHADWHVVLNCGAESLSCNDAILTLMNPSAVAQTYLHHASLQSKSASAKEFGTEILVSSAVLVAACDARSSTLRRLRQKCIRCFAKSEPEYMIPPGSMQQFRSRRKQSKCDLNQKFISMKKLRDGQEKSFKSQARSNNLNLQF